MNVSVDTESAQKPLRADARRNRESILKAARAVFSARGREGHLEEVARRAKVGMGTVYRHFPTKEALLEALAREQFDLLTSWAREALEEPHPGAALEALLWRGAELQASDRALMEAVADFKPSVAAQADELHACTEELLTRAKRRGHGARRRHRRGHPADDVRAGQRDADGRRRLASLPDRHARRHAS